MTWFVFALLTCFLWGTADIFYKLGADESDRYSYLQTSICVGLVMGLHAGATLLLSDVRFAPVNLLLYFPVSFFYISSMTVGYLGLRYLDLSVASPVQNASGAVTCILCVLVLGQTMDIFSGAAVALICAGVLLLSVSEQRRERRVLSEAERKYAVGLRAFMLPIIYCVLDALGTFLDAYYLDDLAATPLRVAAEAELESVATISYELTFFIAAVLLFLYLFFIKKQRPRVAPQKPRLLAALFETAGQFTYVYAMSGNAVAAAPMVASYCIVSVLFSRVFLKEKLTRWQYIALTLVVLGIAALGVIEGMAG